MNIFKKENLKETFEKLHTRKMEISEASECFDGSDGEGEILDEGKMIDAVFDVFYNMYGTTATEYFRLDEAKISSVHYAFDDNQRETDEICFDVCGKCYETGLIISDGFSIKDGVLLSYEGFVIPENTLLITALRNVIEDNKELFENLSKDEDFEKYRFENGSLFEYNGSNYIHVYKSPYAKNKESAIRDYENFKQTFPSSV